MAAHQFLLLLSCLIAVSSPAAINRVTSLDDGEDMNLMRPADLEDNPLKLGPDDLALMTRREEDAEEEDAAEEMPSYVDASEFRHPAPADAVKPKASAHPKKAHSPQEKHEHKQLSVKLEPPAVEGGKPSGDDDVKLEGIVLAVRKFIEAAGSKIVVSLSAENTPTPADSEHSDVTTTTSSPTSDNSELPRLSPPIWSHSSQAEILSDPLRLPLVEPYDRYDRYSHSIARDVVW